MSSSAMNLGRMIANFKARISESVAASVHDYEQLTPNLARVIVCFTSDDVDPADRTAALIRTLGGKAVPVEGSFRPIHSVALPTMVGFVRSNTEALEFSEAERRGMRALASNVLMNTEDDSIWEVRNAGSGSKVLVRQGVEDLRAVLETSKTKVHRTPVLSSMGVSRPEAQKFVAFVDPGFNTVRYGYVLESSDQDLTVMPYVGEEERADFQAQVSAGIPTQTLEQRQAPVRVSVESLVEIVSTNGTDNFAALAAPESNEKDKMIDYYKKMFGYSPEYFEKVKEIIQGHAGL